MNNTNDLISRSDALLALGKDIMGGLNYKSILQKLPSKSGETLWIRDHFPAHGEKVICLLANSDMICASYDDTKRKWESNDLDGVGQTVYAWMYRPDLPEGSYPTGVECVVGEGKESEPE